MKIFNIFILFLFSSINCEPEEDDGVTKLTDQNFDEYFKKYNPLFVNFYAPWCQYCKDLAPDFAQANEELQEIYPTSLLAKVDISEEKKLVENFNIEGFPTLIFFYNGDDVEYTGSRDPDDLVAWFKQKLEPPSKEVKCQEFNQFTSKDHRDNLVSFFGKNNNYFKEIYLTIASHLFLQEKFSFVHVFEECSEYQTNSIVIKRGFDQSPAVYQGKFEKDLIEEWLLKEWIPSTFIFQEEYINIIFTDQKPALMLFVEDLNQNDKLISTFREAGLKYKDEIYFVLSSIVEPIHQKLAEYSFVAPFHIPTLRILDVENNLTKYKYQGDLNQLTVDQIKQFIDDFKQKKLPVFYKSQLPEVENDNPLKNLVGDNFKEKLLDNTESEFLVRFYGEFCGFSKKMEKDFYNVTEELKDEKDLIFVDLDIYNNEIEGIQIRDTPVLRLYKKDKSQFIDIYGKDKSPMDIKEFLMKNSLVYQKYRESHPEEQKSEL